MVNKFISKLYFNFLMDIFGMKRFFSVKLKTTILCLALLLSLFFSACSPLPSVRFPKSPFECDLCWSFDGSDFTASFSSSADSAELKITSPDCLSGSRLYIVNGNISFLYKDIRFDSIPQHYLAIAEILNASGSFDYMCKAQIDGAAAICYSRGEERWYFDESGGLPIRVDKGDLSLKIFNVKE